MRMVVSLGKAKEEDISLLTQLKKAGPSSEVMALHQAAMKGMAALKDDTSTVQALHDEVWAVYDALGKALCLAIQNGADMGLLVHIFNVEPSELGFAQGQYDTDQEYFISEVKCAFAAICEAAAEALQVEA